jgi:glutathione S-transferase
MPEAFKLYHASASPNSRRVRMFLAEKKLALTLVPVDLGKGEQRSDAYRRINPRQMVPTLVLEDGTSIGEVPAIWRYLEEAYPTAPLLGTTPKDKALVTMWERRAALEERRGAQGLAGRDQRADSTGHRLITALLRARLPASYRREAQRRRTTRH